MTVKYLAKSSNGISPRIFREQDEDGTVVFNPFTGDVILVDERHEQNNEDWVWGAPEVDPVSAGWMPVRFLRLPDDSDVFRFPLILEAFVRSCGRAELESVPAEDGQSPVPADYLLAWALIECATSGGTTAEPLSNLLPTFKNSDAVGPFRLTSADWKAYRQAAAAAGIEVSNFEWLSPNAQASGAAFKCSSDVAALAKLRAEGADGPYVPSYLNVLHAHMLGAASASRIQKLMDQGADAMRVDDALADNPDRDTILLNRASFMIRDAKPVTVTMFFELTSQALAEGFKTALELIKQFADFLLPPKNGFSAAAPWMTLAQSELKAWTDGKLTESSGDGLARVKRYFGAIGPHIDPGEPWCGGFIAFCLAEANPSFKSTIVKGAARASKWLNWGNMRVRPDDDDLPVGAIVVAHPLAPKTSGHVGFAVGKVPGTDKIAVLGGNQGDKVSIDHLSKNKIREIRWHNSLVSTAATDFGVDTDPKLKELLALIASGESNGNYNAHYGNSKSQEPKFTSMTLHAVRKWQDNYVASGKNSSAVGKYQIIRSTMDAIMKRQNLDGSELYDENMQDRMAIDLLTMRGIKKFLAGTTKVVDFGNALAMEWAALPVLSQVRNERSGRVLNRGYSYYAGVAGNKAQVMPEQVEAVLERLLSA